MLAIAGVVVVFLAVLGGYLMEQGNPWLLLQPAELLIIGGAALGITMVANPMRIIRKIMRGTRNALRGPSFSSPVFLRYLIMLYEVFGYTQRCGIPALEQDVENPKSSRIFGKYPEFLKDAGACDFVCDSLRMIVIGATNPEELDRLMNIDIDVQKRGDHEPAGALGSIADSLPGLGIVAAVLGIVITMSAIGGAPETIGQKVAAALVGTFIGILLCYGLVGPLASRIEANAEERSQFFQVMRTAVGAYARGASPILAVEYARRSIPSEWRPKFVDMEQLIRREARIPTPEAMPGSGLATPGAGHAPAPAHKEAAPALAAAAAK
jgi:chemotaxis protein MotA